MAMTEAAWRRLEPMESPEADADGLWREGGRQVTTACDLIEHAIITVVLKPGLVLPLRGLQRLTGLGRTPVHGAVTRLAGHGLLTIHQREGLRIAPVDVARERVLLRLRAELEVFALRLAVASPARSLCDAAPDLGRNRQGAWEPDTVDRLERRLGRLVLSAAGEALLDHALRPLRALSRRLGWLHACHLAPDGLGARADYHLSILDAVAVGDFARARDASGRLFALLDTMLDAVARDLDPALLDCGLAVAVT